LVGNFRAPKRGGSYLGGGFYLEVNLKNPKNVIFGTTTSYGRKKAKKKKALPGKFWLKNQPCIA